MLILKRILWFLGLLLFGPIVIILSFPFICAYTTFQTIKDRNPENHCIVQGLKAAIPIIFAFALGLVAGVLAIPYLLLIAMPTYIYKEVKSKKETKRAARENLKLKFEEAEKIQLKINEIELIANIVPM